MKRYGLLLLAISALAVAGQPPVGAKPSYVKTVQPAVKKYCYQCHTGPASQKHVDLAMIKTDADATKFLRMLKKSYASVKNGTMPPKGSPAMPAASVKAFADWLKAQG